MTLILVLGVFRLEDVMTTKTGREDLGRGNKGRSLGVGNLSGVIRMSEAGQVIVR